MYRRVHSIIPTEKFVKDIRHYEKNKIFSHIFEDIEFIVKELKVGHLIGDPIARFGLY